jgi:hypothetical protein
MLDSHKGNSISFHYESRNCACHSGYCAKICTDLNSTVISMSVNVPLQTQQCAVICGLPAPIHNIFPLYLINGKNFEESY